DLDIGANGRFLVEGVTATVAFYEGSPVSVELTTTVDLRVTHTDPGLRGDRRDGCDVPGAAVRRDGRRRTRRHPYRRLRHARAVSDGIAARGARGRRRDSLRRRCAEREPVRAHRGRSRVRNAPRACGGRAPHGDRRATDGARRGL